MQDAVCVSADCNIDSCRSHMNSANEVCTLSVLTETFLFYFI